MSIEKNKILVDEQAACTAAVMGTPLDGDNYPRTKEGLIKYSDLKDAEIMSLMRAWNLTPPLTEEGRLAREEACARCREWENAQASCDTNKRVRVIFHSSSNPSAGPYVFASINDKNFQAPFEKEVEIPEYMLRECIDRAKTTFFEQQEDERGRRVTVQRSTPTYPYTYLGIVE